MHILKDFITIDDLETRWGLDKKQIESFTYDRGDDKPRLMKWYATEMRTRPDGGQSAFVKRAQYLNGCIFDMANVLEIEGLNPELVRAEKDQGDSEPKMIGDKFIFTERQLIKKEDLYKRWFGATHEEIFLHFDKGELRAYKHYKGPINDVVWCNPGQIYYQDKHYYSHPDLYEYHDDQCSYFLLADVVSCETKHPEYTGNVTPENLGLIQDETSGAPAEEPEYIKAEDLRKEMMLSPIQFVNYLRENRDLYAMGPTMNEEYTRWFYKGASLRAAAGELEHIYFHRLDVETHKKRIEEEADSMADIPFGNDAPLFPMTENNSCRPAELQTALEGKDTHIAELEKELAAAKEKIAELETSNTELTTTTRTQAATEARQDKVLSNWQAAFKIMIPVILQCHADGPKKRTKTELQSMCSKHGGGLSATQLDFLRDCLPDEHVNREGGATVQG